MHLNCPHCQSPIELVSLPDTGEVVCESCGSTFRVESGSTVPWDSKSPRKTLGRFELISVVGSGAFGTVYRARDPQLDRTVALKVPRAGNLPEGSDLDRFVREGRSAGQLRHPSIVAVHEVGQAEGVPFIVSDFIEGVTLADRMTAGKPSFRESATIIASVADALEHAHQQGVIHRDIKPSNIMVRPDGSPMVMDFGLAKREAGEVTMTLEGQVLGTPAFMSPEQARGDGHKVDGRSDVYSLGAVLYLLLTGELPFKGNARMLLHQVLNDNPKPPRSLDRTIPRDLETIGLKAMSKDPAARYASAKGLAADLRLWLASRPVLARPVGPGARLGRWCRRNPALTSAIGLALLALAATVVVSTLYVVYKRHAGERLAASDAEKVSALKQVDREKAVGSLERGRTEYRDGEVGRSLLHAVEGLRLAQLSDDTDLERAALASISTYRAEVHLLQSIMIGADLVDGRRGGKVALSRDGRFAVVASFDGTARVFEMESGSPIGPALNVRGSAPDITAVAVGTDGKTAAFSVVSFETKLVDGLKLPRPESKVSIWDLSSGKVLSEPATKNPAVAVSVIAAMDFSPDAKILATGDSTGMARRWEVATGKEVGTALEFPAPKSNPFGLESIHVLRFSPDGRMLAAGADHSIMVWDLTSGVTLFEAKNRKYTTALAFRDDSTALLAGGRDETIGIWEIASGRSIVQIPNKDGPVRAVAFSRDGRLALTGSDTGVARIHEVATGRALGSPMSRDSPIQALTFIDGGRSIACATFEAMVWTWKVAEAYHPRKTWETENLPAELVYGNDGRFLLVSFGNRSQLWDPATGMPLGPARQHPSVVTGMTISPDGVDVLTSAWSMVPEGKGFQPKSQLFRQKLTEPPAKTPWIETDGVLFSATYTRGGREILLATNYSLGGAQLSLRLVDAESGRPLNNPWKPSNDLADEIAIDVGGRIAMTGGSLDRRVQFWSLTTTPPALLGQSSRHLDSVSALALDPAGSKGATGCRDGGVRLWDARTQKQIGVEMKHPSSVDLLLFSPDGKSLLAVGATEARLWDAYSGQPLTPPFKTAHTITSAAFHPDGRTVAIADGPLAGKGTISIWDVPVPASEDVEFLQLKAQVETGLEMSESGEIRVLNPETWLERKGRLQVTPTSKDQGK